MTFNFFDTVDAVDFITVDSLADEVDNDLSVGNVSLREAVALANASELPDLILFADALKGETISLSQGELILDGAVLIDGDLDDDGQPDITIDANSTSRIFKVQAPNVAFDGVTLANGLTEEQGAAIYTQAAFDIANSRVLNSFAADGGGIAFDGAEGRVLNTLLSGNGATNGGGLFVSPGSLVTFGNSSLLSNEALSFGGGLYNAGTVNILNSELDGNQSEISGGGLFNLGEARVESTVLSRNFGRTSGGGITNGNFEQAGILEVVSSQIEDNTADFTGGGVENANGEFFLTDSNVVRNAVDFDGGGIAGSGVITNSEISQNSSYEYGGGLSGTFTITNSVITENSAAFGGGLLGGGTLSNSLVNSNRARIDGAGIQGSGLDITNSTISENTLEGDFFSGAGLSVTGDVTLANSIISGSNGGDDVSIRDSGDLMINGVNLVEDASFTGMSVLNLDPELGEVADNGGSLPSQSLLPGSPAIDVGDNNFVAAEFDQRGEGFNRILDGNGDGDPTVDLGAFEAETVEAPEQLYFTLKKSTVLDGVAFNDEDIIRKDEQGFSKLFDGSDVGLHDVKVNAFDMVSETEILMSFDHSTTLDGVGEVDDSDIVKFTATSLGKETRGVFELYLDGSDVGLDKTEEDIDGLTRLANGEIIVSTKGNIAVPGVDANREDLLRFTPTSLGEDTSGTWSKYLDMSDVELSRTNVDAFHVRETGEVLLSTAGQFQRGGMTNANDDIFGFSPLSKGEDTSGNFSSPLFDGSQFGLLSNSIGALDIG